MATWCRSISRSSLKDRDTAERLEAQHRVVVGAGDLEAFARAEPQRRVVARVEELRRGDRVALAVEHLEVDLDLGVGLARGEVTDRRVDPSAMRSRVSYSMQ